MSLINDMLRNLEARHAADLGKRGLQREIRPLPEVDRPISGSLRIAGVGLALMAVAMAAAGWWRAESWLGTPAPSAPAVQAPAQPPAAAPAPLQPPVPAPSETSPAAVVEALRLSSILENPPVAESTPPPQAKTAVPDRAKSAETPGPKAKLPEPAANEPPSAKSTVTQDASTFGSIEKTVNPGTPRERAEAEFRRAQALLAGDGQSAAGLEALRAALKQDAGYNPARQFLVKGLLELRRIDEAMAVLQEGLEKQPAQIGWAASLARLQVERGDPALAERTLSRSSAYGGNSAEYAGFHGHLLNRLGHFREAVAQYQAATRLAPGDGRWWFGLAQALEGDGHPQEAQAAYRHALEVGNLNADLASLAEQRLR